MAKLVRTISNGSFDSLVHHIRQGILDSSMSASLEDVNTFTDDDARCTMLVFERYSMMGSNRVSMNVTLFQHGSGPIHLCATTSGGSQAMFFKVNTWGEEAFLDKLRELL